MNKTMRILLAFSSVLCALCLFALFTGSRGYSKETPSYMGSVQQIKQVSLLKDGMETSVALPHSFSSLPARTPVTLVTKVPVDNGDCLYVKSVYAPLKVYADGALIFECGQEGSFPKFMHDPPTTVAIVPLDAFSGTVQLRLEYLSLQTRSTLPVQPLIVGQSADIFKFLEGTMGVPFIVSLLQITLGLLLIFTAVTILFFERKGLVFLYLGLASLAVGLWCFGECNITGLIIHNATLLYLLAFIGLYIIPVSLMLFITTMVSFRNTRPLHFLYLVNLSAVAAAFLLQVLGFYGFSQSVRFFHVLLPLSLLFLAGYILYEGLRYKNQSAKRFFPPMVVLAVSAVLEAANYSLRFTNVLSSIFQIGATVFTLMTGVIGGLLVRDAMLRFRMGEEKWSVSSLTNYKMVRSMAWLYYNTKDAVSEFAKKYNCDLALAEEYLKVVRGIRNQQPFYVTDEDGEETGEDVALDDTWNYADILWIGIQAKKVQRAFEKLNYREQTLLEKRLAICMTCGRVGSWKGRPTFEELAVMFEGSTASGAERAYKKAILHLAELLIADDAVHPIHLKQKSKKSWKKKIATATYEYQVDHDGEWGELFLDFETKTAKIIKLADWDTIKSNKYANAAISYLLHCKNEDLPKDTVIPFER